MSPAPTRRIITPEHFKVAPEILGLPLASPSRRAVAMAIDLIIIALLVKTGGFFLGIAAAIILFRASAPDQRSGFIRSSVRTGLRITGAVVLFLVVVNSWGFWRNDDGDADETSSDTPELTAANELDIRIAPGELPRLASAFFALRQAEDSAAVADAARRLLQAGRKGGMSVEDLYDTRSELVDFMGDNADSSEIAAIDDALVAVVGPPRSLIAPEPVARAYLDAVARQDSLAIRAYHDSVTTAFAGEELAKLGTQVERLDDRSDSLARELEQSREARGLRTFIAGAADDFGVGFGWSAVYFTAFLALWRGQTPGKRAARVRVLRLDGKPLGWWLSFERFGGYAASFSVGLMGFFQILWDRNRQGLHDKACETVVVYDLSQMRPRA